MITSILDCRFWLSVVASLAAAAPALAGDDVGHQEARRLVQEGRILPLAKILERVGATVPGKVLKVELELEDGVYVYEIEILRPNGRVQEVEVSARSGGILAIEDDD
ncbi:PepSY domain-containing protein [Methyloceanibacter sp.]|uniref:PepSY domain-containing protein n=1 Tax=Methyloceanibacter sp. TaxID=1965321 RepID=UPI002B68D35F|nr:PepSY domain-containing protein [Methyloceanibacter sp.]HML92054.1 PepSY domain-containing protein [Methyloceanibacter sp.]